MGAGLRACAKALDKPPNPNNGAPVPDPTKFVDLSTYHSLIYSLENAIYLYLP